MADQHDADFIEYVVKQLVENPDAVRVERTVDEMGVLIQLTVDRNDMGRVIGKEGRTAKALRTLLRVLGAKNNARVNLKIMEPEGGEVPIHDDEERQSAPAAATEEPAEAPADVEQPVEPVAEDPKEEKPEEEQQAMEIL